MFFVCFKQKTAYEMRISDWSSDVCSSDLREVRIEVDPVRLASLGVTAAEVSRALREVEQQSSGGRTQFGGDEQSVRTIATVRSEEHTSELQSLMRISYAVFCLKKKKVSKT